MIRRIPLVLAAVCMMGLVSNASYALDSIIVKKPNAQPLLMEGTIKGDTFDKMVIISDSGAEFTIPRDNIIKWQYGDANMKVFEAGIKQLNEGNYSAAYQSFDVASDGIKRFKKDFQKPLFGQHITFYKAMCHFKMGKFKDAESGFGKLLQKVPDTTHLFEAGFYEAKALEMSMPENPGQALSKYELRAKEFDTLIAKHKLGKDAKRWEVMANLAATRIKMTRSIRNKEDKTVKEMLASLVKLRDSQSFTELPASDKAEVVHVIAQALEHLKEWEQLVKTLNAVIRSAVDENNRDALKSLYLKRADANWELLVKSGNKDVALAEMANFDYLRVDMVIGASKEDSARANYRIAESFLITKGQNYLERAAHHLRKCKTLNSDSWSDKASARLSEVNMMLENEKKKEAEKEAAEKAKAATKTDDKKKPE